MVLPWNLRISRSETPEVLDFFVTASPTGDKGRMPFDSGCGKEALMHWTRKLAPAPAIATSVVVMAIGGGVAAQAPGTVDRLPQPLPRQETRDRIQEKEGRQAACPPRRPVSPPTILRPEVQPIDLDTALRLAGVQNPELNVARQRVLEAAAVRQLAAAQFLPSINPGMNYDTHTGNLQQSNGNILSIQPKCRVRRCRQLCGCGGR